VDTQQPARNEDAGVLKKALTLAGSDAARYIPVRFIPALTSLVTVPLFTRAIDPADYGAFYLLNSFLVLGAGVASEWIGNAAVRLYWPSKKAGTLDSFSSTIVWSITIALVAAGAVIAGVSWFGRTSLDPLVVRLVPVAVAYFVLNYALQTYMQVLRAANRAGDYARLSIAATLITNALAVVAVVVLKWGAAGIFAGVAVGSIIMIPWTLARIGTEGSLAPTAARRDLLAEVLSYGIPLIPAGAASWALGLTDRFILQWARGAGEVGLYATAYGLGEKIMQLATLPLILTMMPVLIRTFEEHGQRTAERMQTQFTRYFAMVTLPLLAGLVVVARDFMAVFTGSQYRAAYPVLAIVAVGALLVGLTQIAITGLTIHKRSKRIMANTIAATVFNIALNLVLVPRFGYTAAAWNTVAAYALLLLLTWLQSRTLMRWSIPWGGVVPVAAASAVMAGAVYGLGTLMPPVWWALVVQGAGGIVVYPAALVALGGVRADERAFARDMLGALRARLTR